MLKKVRQQIPQIKSDKNQKFYRLNIHKYGTANQTKPKLTPETVQLYIHILYIYLHRMKIH